MSEDNSVSTLAGGTLRVSVNSGAEVAPQAGPPEANRVHYGHLRADGGGQFCRDDGQSAPAVTGSVLATARSNMGPTSNYRASDTSVEIEPGNPASRTSIAVAKQLGLIRETSPGHYEDVKSTPAEAGSSTEGEQPAAEAAHTPELAEQQAEADWNADIEPLEQFAYDAAVSAGAAAVLDETSGSWQRIASMLSSNTGMSSEAAAEYVEAGYSFFEGQVSKMAQGVGIEDSQAFYSFMRSKHPQALQAATGQLVNGRRLDGFRQLATAYKVEQGKGQLSALRNAGFDGAHVDRDTGETMVIRNGVAVRARDLK